jgi:hypothetical protein
MRCGADVMANARECAVDMAALDGEEKEQCAPTNAGRSLPRPRIANATPVYRDAPPNRRMVNLASTKIRQRTGSGRDSETQSLQRGLGAVYLAARQRNVTQDTVDEVAAGMGNTRAESYLDRQIEALRWHVGNSSEPVPEFEKYTDGIYTVAVRTIVNEMQSRAVAG